MDEQALRAAIDELGRQGSALESWQHFWTVLVIIGCAGELVFVVRGYLGEKKSWSSARNRGLVSFPEKPSFLMLLLEIISVAFVVVGISGELGIDRKSGDVRANLQRANSDLVLLIEKHAGTAGDAAVRAKAAADEAKATAEIAGRIANRAKSTAEGATESADELNKELAITNANTDQKLDVLTSRVIPMGRSNERANSDSLRSFSGTTVSIQYASQKEPKALAENLASVLNSAGWKVEQIVPKNFSFDGITIIPTYMSENMPAGRAAYALADLLDRYTIKSDVVLINLRNGKSVTVLVGLNPVTHLLRGADQNSREVSHGPR